MSASGIFPSDSWTVSQGSTAQGPIFVRYRSGDPSEGDKSLFNKLILVRWVYEPREGTGLPQTADMYAMDEFEDRILDASDEAGWWGSCVAVVTHDAVREWRFYAPDLDAFQREFSEALRDFGPYPLDLRAFDDPDWNGLAELRDSARKPT